MKNLMKKKGIINFASQKMTITFPNNYQTFLDEISSLFNIPKEINFSIIITTNKSSKKLEEGEYYSFIQNIPNDEIPELIIDLNSANTEKAFLEKDSYDKDENILYKNISKSIGGESLDFEQLLNQSFEDSNKILIKSEVPKNTIRFSSYCNICDQFPIINTMYYCPNCDLNLCEKCEKNIGYNHRHCYYKIKNQEQYEEILNIKIDTIIKNRNIDNQKLYINGNNGIFNSIIGIIKGK